MSQSDNSFFSSIRSYLWPIHTHETPKLLPLVIVMACVAFNYSVLRAMKDTVVINAHGGSGAEVIPFIKFWGVFPAALLSTALFSYLINHYSKAVIFRIILGLFALFFTLFAVYIYPHHEAFRLDTSADFLQSILPKGCRGLISSYRNWTLSCFYIVAELWSTLVLQVLVWGFANEITKLSEAPRFYGVLSFAANVASFTAGQLGAFFSSVSYDPQFLFGNDRWEQSLAKQLLLVSGLIVVCLIAFRRVVTHLEQSEKASSEPKKEKKAKHKMNPFESLICISKSKYLLGIAIIVASYHLVINLVEIVWKDQIHVVYPDPADFNFYCNNLTSIMSFFSTIGALLLSGLVGRFGWTKTALLTPVVLLMTSGAFLGCLLGSDYLAPFISTVLGTTPLFVAATLGSAQNCFSKAAKYSVFDATKEMAYIPLDSDEKMKGKAAIDGVGSRMAKSTGSLIYQGLLVSFGSLALSVPYIGLTVIGVIIIWMYAIRALGRDPRLQSAVGEREAATVSVTSA